MSDSRNLLDEIVQSGLYKQINIDGHEEDLATILEKGVIPEAYCTICKSDRSFHYFKAPPQRLVPYAGFPGVETFPKPTKKEKLTTKLSTEYQHPFFYIHARCTVCGANLIYNLKYDEQENSIFKIGQFPSIYNLLSGELKQYRKYFEGTYYKELNRAIGLSTHGTGIGAYVYLRRIIENLIEEAHVECKSSQGWDEKNYQESRVKEKVNMLTQSLSPEVIELVKPCYEILSKGIHELTEKECIEYFDILRLAIEQILDNKIRDIERIERQQQAKKAVSKVKSGL